MTTGSAAGSPSNRPSTLFGYEILETIGHGAASVIYRVMHPETRKIYCLKHVVRETERDERFIEQVENEFEIGRRVSHRGLRRCLEAKANRTLLRKTTEVAMVMELFEGQTLTDRPPSDLLTTIDCFVQVAEALVALHQLGYVHCDLKPSNILRSASGEVKVIDLGQACPDGTPKKRIQGTPDYIAPEQVKCLPVSPRTDVYNLGATMYWTTTGKNLPTLFTLEKGENSFLVDGQIPSPRELNPNVPQQLSNLIMECAKVVPGKRPEMPDVVRRLQIIDHVARRPVHRPEPEPEPEREFESEQLLEEEEQVSLLGTQLERAMTTIRQQNATISQLRLAVQERDAKLLNAQKEKESALKPLQDACAQKDSEIAQLKSQIVSVSGMTDGLTKQMDDVRRILGSLPDESDARTVAEFNKMFAAPAPAPANGRPVGTANPVRELPAEARTN